MSAPRISPHLRDKLAAIVATTGMMKPDDALEIATHHLAVSVAAMTTIKGLRRGEARALARKHAEVAIELATAVWDQQADHEGRN